MADLIVIAVLVLILGAAITYIMKAKKRGVKCIGCPAGAECARKCNGGAGCACGASEECDSSCHTDTK